MKLGLTYVTIMILVGLSVNAFAQQTPEDWSAPIREGLRDLREGVAQGRQMKYEAEDRARAEQQRQAEMTGSVTLPIISANGFECEFTEETRDAIFCLGSFQRMNPKITVGGLSPKLVTLIANGIDTETGKRSTFLYESLTGCVSIVTDNGKTTIDRQGKTHKLKRNQKIKGCLN